jgi:hypothetical protein
MDVVTDDDKKAFGFVQANHSPGPSLFTNIVSPYFISSVFLKTALHLFVSHTLTLEVIFSTSPLSLDNKPDTAYFFNITY